MLATIGIEPGKPFDPPEKLKAPMEKGIVNAYHYMQDLDTKRVESLLARLALEFCDVLDEKQGFDFVSEDAVEIDRRAAARFFYTYYPKVLTDRAATAYLAPIADSRGEPRLSGLAVQFAR